MRLLRSPYATLVLCLALVGSVAPFTPGLATTDNLRTLLAYLLPLLVASLGLTWVMILGGIDLSLTSIIALASVVGARVMSAEGGWLAGHPLATPAAVAAMLLVGALLGAANGGAVALGRIPPFIATLTTMMFVSGFALWLTQSRKIGGLPPAFLALGQHAWIAAGIAAAATALAHLGLSRTLLGRWVFAVGHNPRTAQVSGVPVDRVTFAVYLVSGLYAGLAAVLFTSVLETGNPEMARDNLLDVVGAVVIGGTSLFGGRGSVLGTVLGVLFMALVDNSLNLIGVSFYAILMVKGGVILAAALLDAARTRWAEGAA